jgi:hypothetical protein
MDRYRITRYHGESEPCAVIDPNGCFYSVGEVDRTLSGLEIELSLKTIEASMYFAGGNVLEKKLEEAQILITDMVAWFKWTQPYPTICVQEFIARGDALVENQITTAEN